MAADGPVYTSDDDDDVLGPAPSKQELNLRTLIHGDTPLMKACKESNALAVKKLLETSNFTKSFVRHKNADGNTALHICAMWETPEEPTRASPESAEYESYIDVDNRREQIIICLLQHTDIDKALTDKNNANYTPIQLLCKSQFKNNNITIFENAIKAKFSTFLQIFKKYLNDERKRINESMLGHTSKRQRRKLCAPLRL